MKVSKSWREKQTGAASLVITLVLMMSITIVTLAVARTLLVEQRMAANHHRHTRLQLEAEAGLAKGMAYLSRSMHAMTGPASTDSNLLIDRISLSSADADIQTHVVLHRQSATGQYIALQATAWNKADASFKADVSQTVRPLSILTPLAESAPPLILNGCLTDTPVSFDIRPLHADSGQAGDAMWLNEDSACSALKQIDLHKGRARTKKLADDLWPLIFSVSREAFQALSSEQSTLADDQRRYWLADRDGSGHWHRSLGSPDRPVALYFSAAIGCPVFADGVRLYGLVFIDADCPEPIADRGMEVFGTLVINGNLNSHGARLNLNHIQLADSRQTRLQFPLLRSVAVPGTWKDF